MDAMHIYMLQMGWNFPYLLNFILISQFLVWVLEGLQLFVHPNGAKTFETDPLQSYGGKDSEKV